MIRCDLADGGRHSGARKLMCIMPIGGDVGLKLDWRHVTASVKEATPESAVKAGTVVKCVVVRMRKEARRKDALNPFDDNAAVLINDANEPVGTRVFGRWPESCATEIHQNCLAGSGSVVRK